MKSHSIKYIISQFPKVRPELPDKFKIIYNDHYKKNRNGSTQVSSLSMRMEKWLHRMVAKDIQNSNNDYKTLEIGAGTLNQLPFEPTILNYDVIEPFSYLYENSKYLDRVKNIYKDIRDINNFTKYLRITSVATFEHITNLPEVVARAVVLMEEKGSLRVSIPNEGTILWKLGTRVSGFEFKRLYKLDYQTLMKHEHINTAREIEAVLKYFFFKVSSKSYGINRHLAIYRFFECKEPNYMIANQYLEETVKVY
jgi:hypothetical protein